MCIIAAIINSPFSSLGKITCFFLLRSEKNCFHIAMLYPTALCRITFTWRYLSSRYPHPDWLYQATQLTGSLLVKHSIMVLRYFSDPIPELYIDSKILPDHCSSKRQRLVYLTMAEPMKPLMKPWSA